MPSEPKFVHRLIAVICILVATAGMAACGGGSSSDSGGSGGISGSAS